MKIFLLINALFLSGLFSIWKTNDYINATVRLVIFLLAVFSFIYYLEVAGFIFKS